MQRKMHKNKSDKLTIIDTDNGAVLVYLDKDEKPKCSTAVVQQNLDNKSDAKDVKDEKNVAPPLSFGPSEGTDVNLGKIQSEFHQLLSCEMKNLYSKLGNQYLIRDMLNNNEAQIQSLLDFAYRISELMHEKSFPVIRAIIGFLKKYEGTESHQFDSIYRQTLEAWLQVHDKNTPKILDGKVETITASFRC